MYFIIDVLNLLYSNSVKKRFNFSSFFSNQMEKTINDIYVYSLLN